MRGKRAPKDLKEARNAFESCKKICREQLGMGARGRLSNEESEKFYGAVYDKFVEVLKSSLNLEPDVADQIARESIEQKQVPERPWFAPEEENGSPTDVDGQAVEGEPTMALLPGLPGTLPSVPVDSTNRAGGSKRNTNAAPQPANHAANLHTLAAAAGSSTSLLDPTSLLRQCGTLMLHLADAREELEQLKREPLLMSRLQRDVYQLKDENKKLLAEYQRLLQQLESIQPRGTDKGKESVPEAADSARGTANKAAQDEGKAPSARQEDGVDDVDAVQ